MFVIAIVVAFHIGIAIDIAIVVVIVMPTMLRSLFGSRPSSRQYRNDGLHMEDAPVPQPKRPRVARAGLCSTSGKRPRAAGVMPRRPTSPRPSFPAAVSVPQGERLCPCGRARISGPYATQCKGCRDEKRRGNPAPLKNIGSRGNKVTKARSRKAAGALGGTAKGLRNLILVKDPHCTNLAMGVQRAHVRTSSLGLAVGEKYAFALSSDGTREGVASTVRGSGVFQKLVRISGPGLAAKLPYTDLGISSAEFAKDFPQYLERAELFLHYFEEPVAHPAGTKAVFRQGAVKTVPRQKGKRRETERAERVRRQEIAAAAKETRRLNALKKGTRASKKAPRDTEPGPGSE